MADTAHKSVAASMSKWTEINEAVARHAADLVVSDEAEGESAPDVQPPTNTKEG